MEKFITYLALLISFCQSAWAGRTINVPSNNVSDHGDPRIEGSLQNIINGAEPGDQIVLSENAVYKLKSRLILKGQVAIKGKYGAPGYRLYRPG